MRIGAIIHEKKIAKKERFNDDSSEDDEINKKKHNTL